MEEAIANRGYQTIYLETASVLKEARQLYKSAGYLPVEGTTTVRCDRRLYKNLVAVESF
jgi:putative acetyltransferase